MFNKLCYIYLSIVFLIIIFPNRRDTLFSTKGGDLYNSLSKGLCGNRYTVPIEIYDKCFAPFKAFPFDPRNRIADKNLYYVHQYDWPWFVKLDLHLYNHNNSFAFCGGVIITEHWILTAAHCLEFEGIGPSIKPNEYHKLKIHTFGKYPQTFDVELIRFPEGRRSMRVRLDQIFWRTNVPFNWKMDLALIKTTKPMNSFGITNVCLRDSERITIGRRVEFIGLGNTAQSGQWAFPKKLQETAFIGKTCVHSKRFGKKCSEWDCFCHNTTAEWYLDDGGPAMIAEWDFKYETYRYSLVAIMVGFYENQIILLKIWPFLKWIKDLTDYQYKQDP